LRTYCKCSKNTKDEKGCCKAPGNLFDYVRRARSAQHLVGLGATESGINTTAFRILYEYDEHEEEANDTSQNSEEVDHGVIIFPSNL